MDTSALKKLAPAARNQLIHQVRSRLDLVLGEDSAARREHPKVVKDLQAAIAKHGKDQVVEQVAYTWFNRFTALRFMDANGYALVRVVSPAEGQSRPEILAEAAAGHVEDFVPERTREKVLALLDGRSPSRDPQSEAYRLLLVAACNHWHSVMPFLFERIDDYTELLLPEDLLSPSSILGQLREVMTEPACQDVEIIGWLYQFYISEKKDQVFAGLKKNQKITAENIPAATQLFTPHWIVRYLVENSLGRLWLLNRPGSKLAERMDYYIAPEEPETDFLRIGKPEEIKVCDPACGSGHMLTYAFDLLHAIYEEEGYEATEIPGLILQHNLTGIEIDDRAGALAAFALAMKAAAKLGRRRFLRQVGKDEARVQPNIVVLQNISFSEDEIREVGAWVEQSQSGDLSLEMEGPVNDDLSLELEGPVYGDLSLEMEGPVYGDLSQEMEGPVYGELNLERKGPAYDVLSLEMEGPVYDDLSLELEGPACGRLVRDTLKPSMGARRPPSMAPDGPETILPQRANKRRANLEGGVSNPDSAHETGRRVVQSEFRETLGQFEQAKNFGSLIVPKLRDPAEILKVVEARDFAGDLLLNEMQERVIDVLRMADSLSPKYHVVVANPPYMGGKGMNERVAGYLKSIYPDEKSDLYAAFITRGFGLLKPKGLSGMVTMESWMFLSSFEKFRGKVLSDSTIYAMLHMPYLGKGRTSMGINFGTTAFISERASRPNLRGDYRCVRYYEADEQGVPLTFPPENERANQVSHAAFARVPGSPIAYWLSKSALQAFQQGTLGDLFNTDGQNKTSDNDKYLRLLWEVSAQSVGRTKRWLICAKGGDFRKWYGNLEFVIDWSEAARTFYRKDHSARILAEKYWYQEGITWTDLTSASTAFRVLPEGTTFETKGPSLFPYEKRHSTVALAYLNSKMVRDLLKALNPTMSTKINEVRALPTIAKEIKFPAASTEAGITTAKSDWDAYETSWDFTELPLLSTDHRVETLEATYARLRAHWQGMTDEMQRLEEENNRIFIDAYGLQDELTPEVPIEEITLTCNPAYRYGGKATAEELETRLLADTMAEFLSYAVGCMFGRYSLDAPGLVVANQGEGLADYLARVPEPTFMPDAQNVIPVLDGDWFADDITERFRKFLRLTFGEATFQQNLRFIEDALGKDIRKYFTRDFYSDHVKRYKKRPIYWMFASPKGSFQTLIYMHRYRPDTVSVVLNDYLREYRNKLEAYRSQQQALFIRAGAPQVEKTRALKEIDRLNRVIQELTEWEREVLYPLATQRIEIDLDDGVKANYPKFGAALKKIAGLDTNGE